MKTRIALAALAAVLGIGAAAAVVPQAQHATPIAAAARSTHYHN
jgi:hypothetical protein